MRSQSTTPNPNPEPKATHLGDGAYLTNGGYELIVTANHHDPEQATDRVYIEARALPALLHFLLEQKLILPGTVLSIAKQYIEEPSV